MYLHIGNGKTVRTADIVGIFDLDTATVSKVTRTYLSSAEKRGELQTATDEIPKSFAVMTSNKNCTIYFSQLSAKTLVQRIDSDYQ
ncbi:MAG: DUF370 domain-containing protein [Clostridia bacterium]|nr:DUF370 domain-containing protein [Clostridia bacterium]